MLTDEHNTLIRRLNEARVLERMEPFLAYYDDHEHLQNLTARNNIIRDGWKAIDHGVVYQDGQPPQRGEGPPSQLASPAPLMTRPLEETEEDEQSTRRRR